ncbi:hypothetical protein [Streptococcus oralis]|uniref:Uncharacterized protein n=1 Tax=Streptococcus oralis SK610 TaxID=1095741 RepID=I0Q4Y9_STROR|nr:hypothetical protein [Streptococcus oralis]EIC76341.1 hypothetical protein HMPREF1115_1295 [Streptococcus oralis SK610]
MRLYIKGDYTKEIPFDYMELAKRMWFDTKDGKTVDISYFGNTRPFKTDPTIHLKLNKWMHDNRWNNVQLKEGIINKFGSHVYENLELDFEDNPATDYREKGDCLRLATTHLDLLTVDKRAMYIMAVEVASAIDGQISEDDKETWMDVETFKELHKDVLSLSYDKATDISVEELKSLKPVEEPLWDEEERLREEYIKIHGERVYDDEEDE